MRKLDVIFVGVAIFYWNSLSMAGVSQCFEEMPGEERIPYDAVDAIKITKLKVSSKNKFAYIATEYLGAVNLQATIYLKRSEKYCFSGNLGAVTDFMVDKSIASGGLYGIASISNSGGSKFRRQFDFNEKSSEYELFSCRVSREGGVWRKCTASEE